MARDAPLMCGCNIMLWERTAQRRRELVLFFTFLINSKITRIRGRIRLKIRHNKKDKSRYGTTLLR